MTSHTESVYIHIPFCESKCKYCSFVSFVNQDKKTGYLYSLLKEIDYYYKDESIKTLYIGGGTPSCLSTDEIQKIISKFKFQDRAEITIELNPNDVTKEYTDELKKMGFNRISMGAQSFDNSILKTIGRRHSAEEISHSVQIARNSGFDNISLDLIYGLPTQTLNGFRDDLEKVIDLGVEHISLYGLKIDEGCYFYKNKPHNLPDEDMQADMYLMAGEIMKEYGYNHYEVSNYSKSDYESRHNSNYWRCGEYYGFGVSAHGYVDGVRYSNSCELEQYLNNPISHEYGKFLTDNEKLEEKIFLGFRLFEGLNKYEINKEFGIDFDHKYKKVLDKYITSGHMVKTPDGYRLSDDKNTNGFLISNIILADFIE